MWLDEYEATKGTQPDSVPSLNAVLAHILPALLGPPVTV